MSGRACFGELSGSQAGTAPALPCKMTGSMGGNEHHSQPQKNRVHKKRPRARVSGGCEQCCREVREPERPAKRANTEDRIGPIGSIPSKACPTIGQASLCFVLEKSSSVAAMISAYLEMGTQTSVLQSCEGACISSVVRSTRGDVRHAQQRHL